MLLEVGIESPDQPPEAKKLLGGRIRNAGWPTSAPEEWTDERIEWFLSYPLEEGEEEWVAIPSETPLEAARWLVACLPPIKVFGYQQKELREEAEARLTTPKALLRELFVEGLFLAKGELATPQRIRLGEKWVQREGRISTIEPRLLGVYEYLRWFYARAANWARDPLGRLEAPAQKGKRPCLSCGKEDSARPPRFPSTPETHLEETFLWAALDAFLGPEEQALCKSLQAGASDEEIVTTLGLSPVNERKRRQRLKEKIKAFLLS